MFYLVDEAWSVDRTPEMSSLLAKHALFHHQGSGIFINPKPVRDKFQSSLQCHIY